MKINVHLELTNYCNLQDCATCPVNSSMKRKKQPMPFELIQQILYINPEVDFYGLNNWELNFNVGLVGWIKF